MGVWTRGWFAFAVTVAVAIAGLIYARVGTVLIEIGRTQSSGPFDPLFTHIETIVPLLLAAILVGVAVYVVVGGVQEERTVERRPPRR